MTRNSGDHAAALLLEADKTHGVHAGPEAVKQALGHSENGLSFAEWVNHHLESETLLTQDELAVYAALDADGQVDALASTQDLAQVHAVSEDEIRAATEELRRSTEAIRKQTEVLQLQSQALDRLKQKRTGNDASREELERSRHRKCETERKHLSGEVDSLSYSIEQRLADLSQHGESLVPRMKTAVEDDLRSNDQLLMSLQKLGRELDYQDPQEPELVERMRDICLRLIKTIVETIRTRLDRVYLESLAGAAYQDLDAHTTSAEVKALGEEVESLYAEILPVAQMSVEQQRLDPALKSISTRENGNLGRSSVALTYIARCLEHLDQKVSSLGRHINTATAHHRFASNLTASAREELSVASSPAPKPAEPAAPASPVRRPFPIRMRANISETGSRRRSSGVYEAPALDNLLEYLGVQLPEDNPSSQDRIAHASQVLQQRSAKRGDIVRNAQDSYEALTTSHLDDLRSAVQLLGDNALAETAYNEVKLVDPDFQGSIDLLEMEVIETKENLSRLEMKHISKKKKSDRMEDMIKRWAS